MRFGRFRLGMRTFKSALSVFICILLFHFLDRGEPLIAALAAVFSLRQDLTTTFNFGKSRVIGNSLGGSAAILYLLVKNHFQSESFFVELIVLPILVALVIIVSDGIGNNSGIISSIATLLLITMSVPSGESVIFAVHRVLDTFIGTLVAIGINFFLRIPKPESLEELTEDLTVLRTKEVELRDKLEEIQAKIKKNETPNQK